MLRKLIAISAVLVLTACASDEETANKPVDKVEDKTEQAVSQQPSTAAPTVATPQVTEDSEIKQAVDGAVKSYVYLGHETDEDALWLTLTASSNTTRQDALADAVSAIKSVYVGGLMNDVPALILSLNVGSTEVMIVELSKSTLDSVDVNGLLVGDISAMADYYWQDASLK